MNEQAQLALSPEKPKASLLAKRAAAEARLPELVDILRGGPKTRRELEAFGFDERALRWIMEADKESQVLAYPGSHGYRLFDQATLADIRRADALRRQAQVMSRRWLGYQRRLHRRGGA